MPSVDVQQIRKAKCPWCGIDVEDILETPISPLDSLLKFCPNPVPVGDFMWQSRQCPNPNCQKVFWHCGGKIR